MSVTEENEHISNLSIADDYENLEPIGQQREEVGTEFEKQENQQTASSENQKNVDVSGHEIGTRSRKPTERGRAYHLELLTHERQNCYRNLASQIRSTYEMLNAETDLRVLVSLRDTLDKSREELNLAQKALSDAIESEKDKITSYDWFDLRDREFMECRYKLIQRIQTFEKKYSQANSVKSGKSRHSESIASSRSARSMLLEAAAKSAKLRAEIDFLDHEKELRRLQLLKEVSIADAEEKAFKRIINEENRSTLGDAHELEENYNSNNFNIQSNLGPHDYNLNPPAQSYAPTLYLSQRVQHERNHDIPLRTIQTKPTQSIKSMLPAESYVPSPYLPQHVEPRTAQNYGNIQLRPTPIKAEPTVESKPPTHPTTFNEIISTHNPVPIMDTLQQLVEVQTRQAELSALLTKQNIRNHLPVKEPPTFNGNVFDYPPFTTAFDSIICDNVPADRDRLYFLNKYTVGQANEVVKGFLAVNSDNAYKEARKLLDERFGNPVHVAEAYKSKLRNWPSIRDGDSTGLRAYSDFLIRCKEAVKAVGCANELDSNQTLHRISAKLPSYSGTKWCRQAYETRAKSGSVTFSNFVAFVKQESDLANDPVFSPDALKRERKNNYEKADSKFKGQRGNQSKAGSFATSSGQNEQNSRQEVPKCPSCSKSHNLEKCPDFKGKKLDERREFVFMQGLCFGCFKKGHLSSNCRSRMKCGECGKLHPTLLHGIKPKVRTQRQTKNEDQKPPAQETRDSPLARQSESANANASICGTSNHTEDTEVVTAMFVPVILTHKDRPHVEVQVYALLDDGSDSTFVKNSVLNDLGVSGTEVSLKLNTMHGQTSVPVQRIDGLVAQKLDKSEPPIPLPKAYSREAIPSRREQIPTPETASKWSHLEDIKEQIPSLQDGLEIGLLIGCNCPKALKPQRVIPGREDDPYAILTRLGWGIIGPANLKLSADNESSTCNRIVTCEIGSTKLADKFVLNTRTKEIINPGDVTRMFELDFSEREREETAPSKEDRRFLEIVKNGVRHRDGRYEIPLPLKDKASNLPNNRMMAVHRLKPLKKRLESNDKYREDYMDFMKKVIGSGYAERIPKEQGNVADDKPVWYIPHHGVYHPRKPNKIRVVFDCSAQYQGESLNNHLLQGPDLTNNLTGVLCRFRREYVAVMCDIEAMFYQVKVPEEYRDYLRFLWWENGDTSKDPEEYRMTVHLFGAASSPGCSNFALKSTADDNEKTIGSEAAEFVRRDFYVDDGLKSVLNIEDAVKLVCDVKEMCKRGGFNLHKFTSNSKEVLERIPESDRAEEVKNLNFDRDTQPTERALGIQWCIESDVFKFTIALKERPCTRRGILSTVSSIFDPLGFVAPVLLEGKSILQELCRKNLGWDDPVPEDIVRRWCKWKSELKELESFSIQRCYKPKDFGPVAKCELHHFSDASFKGYSQCSYLRMVDVNGRVHCSFVLGKSRVTPLKAVTVPRLELTAAVVSVKVSEQLRRELDMSITQEYFWTDSQVVLGYIGNEVRRFHVFVANRVQRIQESSSLDQWRYVDTKQNPADDGSRGLRPDQLAKSKWSNGPDFLWKVESDWENTIQPTNELSCLSENDPEVKKAVSLATVVDVAFPTLLERLAFFSNWERARKALALCCRYASNLKARVRQRRYELRRNSKQVRKGIMTPVSIEELRQSECVIVKAVQREAELNCSSSGPLAKLDPYEDADGIVRVGGRLQLANLAGQSIHPAVLPRKNHITDLIVRCYHQRVQHQGRGITLNEIRANGYWILGASSVVSKAISQCVTCRKLRGSVQEQHMAVLPSDRVEPAPPFTSCAVDYFGPFVIKEGRKELKRYGVLFTCMASRAVHIEVAASLETDSFINALRRFLSRRGPIRQLRSDQGTNFVGAKRQLKEALQELDQGKIRNELERNNCDWFDFKMNVPSASHMGGVWERQIRTVRNVLSAILERNGLQLNDEALTTYMCEVEAIVNSRPLTVESLNDPKSPNPLTPNHLLTMKTKVLLPPPGVFQSADLYCKQRWRRVQHLANEFWIRWRKEYLLNMQQRQKWNKQRRDSKVGDVVLIKEDVEVSRNQWQLAKVVEVYESTDGRVRSVKLLLADRDIDKKGKRTKPSRFLDRPIQKLVLLQEAEEV